MTTSIQAFATEDEAVEAFDRSRTIAESCTTYVSESSGNPFERAPTPPILEAGDESFDLFARNVDSGLLVGDYFVRQGQFVYDFRVIRLQNSSFSDGELATLADLGIDRYLAWVEETTG